MRSAGFTLLETLVGLLVLGLIIVGLTGGAEYGVRAARSQAAMDDNRDALAALDRTLRKLVAEADPREAMRGTQASLSLLSTLPDQKGEADIALGMDESHRLTLHWTPHQAGRPLGPSPAPQQTDLLAELQGLAISYWPVQGGAWRSDWTEQALPGLVRLRLLFASDDRRHWPDIIVAPMRRAATLAPRTGS